MFQLDINNWVLNTGKATGTTNLTSYVKAFVPFKWDQNSGTRYGHNPETSLNGQKRLVAKNPSTPYIWGIETTSIL